MLWAIFLAATTVGFVSCHPLLKTKTRIQNKDKKMEKINVQINGKNKRGKLFSKI